MNDFYYIQINEIKTFFQNMKNKNNLQAFK